MPDPNNKKIDRRFTENFNEETCCYLDPEVFLDEDCDNDNWELEWAKIMLELAEEGYEDIFDDKNF